MRLLNPCFLLLCSGVFVSAEEGESTTGQEFQRWLSLDRDARPALSSQPFSETALSRREADIANQLLWDDHVAEVRAEREKEMSAKALAIGEFKLRFEFKTFGKKPKNGRSLYISMHGGGGAPAEVNDKQWKNQIGLYKPMEGIYLAPRAPSDKWNLWHRSHIDPLFDRLIENLIILEDVDPNRVYLMGYSAGGDGVYQLAPRMADRLAAAAMMAGHPNDAELDGLRNIGFTLHMGAEDGAFDRNQVAARWKVKLDQLRNADPDGYAHQVQIHEGKGHWMDREDAVAVPWMAGFTRNPHPDKVVWRQAGVVHPRFYWLAVDPKLARKGQRIVASIEAQAITIEEHEGVDKLTLLLTDSMLDLDQDITVKSDAKVLFSGKVPRTIKTLSDSLSGRPDPTQCYWSQLKVDLP